MVGASKILTVSYGTFSCTLEGFDDPFNTMKAIAEYFRDLAAEDRYFGAEPPTPDAAMLHRIAEREVQRRVEAKVQENGVILRAHEDAPVARATEIAPVLGTAAESTLDEAIVEAVAEPLADAVAEPFVAEAPFIAVEDDAFDMPVAALEAAQPTVSDMPEGVAARLAKIRAAVALTESAPAVSDYVEDQHAEESFAAFETLDDTVVPSVADVSFTAEDEGEDLAGLAALDGVDLSTVQHAEAAQDDAVAEVFADDAIDTEIVDEEADTSLHDDVADEGYLTPVVAADSADDDDVLANLTATFAGDQPTETPLADTAAYAEADDLVLSALQDDAAVAETLEAADDLTADTADAAPAAEVPAVEDFAAPEPMPVVADTLPEADPAPVDPVVAAAPDATDKLQRARARIIRVRRAPEIALAKPAEPAAPTLSDEAEAELARELAALEDAGEGSAAPTQHADDDLRRQLSALGAEEPGAQATPALDPAVQDESLRRLMDQTQSEMAEPGNRRRLSSIAHLKAAVAATIAERFGTKPKPVEEVEAVRTEPYRNDLARAVRPVRPTASGTATERPTPLVLVSEQRIDRPAVAAPAGPVTPVRPRRVSAQAVAMQESYDEDFDAEDDDTDNIFGDSKGFTEFADRMGATDLSELLEAAAAYSSAVEGRAHFTRPQLLRQIAAVTGNDVSREDELRGFGALLRDGRIVKVKRGQFALTEQSSYLSAARSISG